MSDFQIVLIPCLNDNYCVLIHDPTRAMTAAVDAPDVGPIRQALEARGWQLTHLFITHHHHDHTAGIQDLKKAYGCIVIGPDGEADRIEGVDTTVGDGGTFEFAGSQVEVIATPGHTLGHISYHLPTRKLAFTGDTLFALGCGRVFEGSMRQMYDSLSRLAALPDDTVVYCGHEYTLANGRFALTVEPENKDLQARMADIESARAAGQPTLPTTIDLEKRTNPFLRTASSHIRARLDLDGSADWQVFARLREMKNKA